MISFLLVFILMALTGISSALAAAWWYEREMRLARAGSLDEMVGEIDRLAKESRAKGEELALQKGIAAGRECDAIQRKITDCLSKGRPVSVGFGGKEQK